MKSAIRLSLALAACVCLMAASPRADRLPDFSLDVAQSTIHVSFAPGAFDLPGDAIPDWIANSANAIATYYGRFPVSELRILIVPVEGSGIKSGKAYGYRGAAIRVSLGRSTVAKQLHQDWVMPHEMVHLAFPSVPDAHTWIEEGLATYVEPWARLQAGHVSARQVWLDLANGLPKGLPRAGDEGLDRTHTWGRTYWGGALFCLLADVEIRKRSGNERNLQDALRAIVAAGGNIENNWPLSKALAIGDEAVGIPVLTELYEEMRETAVTPDLSKLWGDLGVNVDGGAVSYDDGAPLAYIRRAMAANVIAGPAGEPPGSRRRESRAAGF